MANREHAHAVEPAPDVEPRHQASAPARAKGPTAAEFVASLSPEHIRNVTWALENADELAKHEGRWVVIAGQRIHCSGDSMEEVEQQAVREGLDRRGILVEYVYPFDISLSCRPGR